MINSLVEKGLKALRTFTGDDKTKRMLVMASIANAINCSVRTLENAKYSEKQILGADKSKLLKIHAKENGVIK